MIIISTVILAKISDGYAYSKMMLNFPTGKVITQNNSEQKVRYKTSLCLVFNMCRYIAHDLRQWISLLCHWAWHSNGTCTTIHYRWLMDGRMYIIMILYHMQRPRMWPGWCCRSITDDFLSLLDKSTYPAVYWYLFNYPIFILYHCNREKHVQGSI